LWDGRNRDGLAFREYFPPAFVKASSEVEMRIEAVNDSALQIVGVDNLDSVIGTNPLGVVFSEYSQMPARAWHLIDPILAENGGWAGFNFTPRGRNHAYELYQMALTNPDWYCSLLTVDDTRRDAAGEDGSPVIPPSELARARREGMPEALIQQEYYCSFEAGSALQFIPGELIQRALARETLGYDWAPKVVGVDVGRNRDRSVLTVRQGGRILERLVLRPELMRSNPTQVVGGAVAQVIRLHHPSAVFVDAVGVGAGLVDYLRLLGYAVVPVLGNSQPSDPRYFNKRAECWGLLRDWLRDSGHLERERDRTLMAELQLPEIRYKGDREWLTPKDELEADEDLEGFVSPDEADSLALTFAQPVTLQARTPVRQPQQAEVDWNPLASETPRTRRDRVWPLT
jgi:hypothetical protein